MLDEPQELVDVGAAISKAARAEGMRAPIHFSIARPPPSVCLSVCLGNIAVLIITDSVLPVSHSLGTIRTED